MGNRTFVQVYVGRQTGAQKKPPQVEYPTPGSRPFWNLSKQPYFDR